MEMISKAIVDATLAKIENDPRIKADADAAGMMGLVEQTLRNPVPVPSGNRRDRRAQAARERKAVRS